MTRTERPDAAARAMARLLSELLSSDAGASALPRLWNTSASPSPSPASTSNPLADARPAPLHQVGIWASTDNVDNPRLVRREDSANEWRLWADVECIPARGTRPRVVLLGESVARGYFYDPVATPATLLAQMLSVAAGGEVEVVDLARTDLAIGDLGRLVREAAALRPDAVVLFAGNNWQQVSGDPDQLHELATVLRSGGLERAGAVLLARAAARGGAVLDVLGLVARVHSLPVVIVIPEFNLVGWRPSPALPPTLPDDSGVAWWAARNQALLALAERRSKDGLAAAERLMALDGGMTGEGWSLLAEARWRLGDKLGVRSALEAARDVPSGQLMPDTPRCASSTQELMRAKAARHGFALVDLPELLAFRSGDGLPDPTTFLDYCHLTWDGLTIAMAQTASRLSAPVLGRQRPAEWFADRATSPSDRDEAVARFLAAVHNAHFGQPHETVRARCADALRVSPSVAPLMERYVDFRTRQASDWMCTAFRQAVAHPSVARYFPPKIADASGSLEDCELVQTTIAVLTAGGIDIEQQAQELLCAEHGLRELEEFDLFESCSRATRSQAGWQRLHVRANASVSRFHLVAAKPAPVRLVLTARLPPGAIAANVVLAVNGQPIQEVELDERWRTLELRLPGQPLVRGLNLVSLQWPPPRADRSCAIARGAEALERGELPDLALVFGEVAGFVARLDRPV